MAAETAGRFEKSRCSANCTDAWIKAEVDVQTYKILFKDNVNQVNIILQLAATVVCAMPLHDRYCSAHSQPVESHTHTLLRHSLTHTHTHSYPKQDAQ